MSMFSWTTTITPHVFCAVQKVDPRRALLEQVLNQMGIGERWWAIRLAKVASMRKERVPAKFEFSPEENKSREHRMPKGYVPVLVGEATEMKKFLVSIEVFKQPSFVGLLEMAAQEFGYKQKGVLRIPCDVVHFQQVLEVISKAM